MASFFLSEIYKNHLRKLSSTPLPWGLMRTQQFKHF